MKVRQMVQAANFNRFHRAGLSATQFMALNVIPKAGMTLSQLARQLNLSPATLNETINSLQERGLVVRERNPEDRRKVDIRATAEGEELQNSASREFHGYIAEIFGKMGQPARDGLLRGLEQMVRIADVPDGRTVSRHADDAVPARRSSD